MVLFRELSSASRATCYFLPPTFYLLLSTSYFLPPTFYLLLSAYRYFPVQLTADCQLQTFFLLFPPNVIA